MDLTALTGLTDLTAIWHSMDLTALTDLTDLTAIWHLTALTGLTDLTAIDIVWCHLLLCNGTACCATSAEGEAKGHSAKGTHEGGWTSTRPSATVIEAIFETIAFTTGPGGSTGI